MGQGKEAEERKPPTTAVHEAQFITIVPFRRLSE